MDKPREGLSYKEIESKPQDMVIDTDEADADIGYFELQLEEFKNYFNDTYLQNRLSNQPKENNPREDLAKINKIVKIYDFILGKNKEMLRAVNKERNKNDEYK